MVKTLSLKQGVKLVARPERPLIDLKDDAMVKSHLLISGRTLSLSSTAPDDSFVRGGCTTA